MAKRGSRDRQDAGPTQDEEHRRDAGATPEEKQGGGRRYDGEFVGRGMRDPRTLVPHPNNRAFPTNDDEWKSFVRSIKDIGVIAPLICRLREDQSYQIVCGHRRQAAAIEVGLAEVPVELRQMDDKTAVAILTIENLQRRNPTPLQQAQGIADMMAVGWTLDEVAAELGMAPSVVARRNQLNHLTTAWQKLIVNPQEKASEAPVGVLERIARLPAELQDDLAKRAKGETNRWSVSWFLSAEDFVREIETELLHRLSKVPWKLDDATLHPKSGPCTTCPRRSGAQPLLWEGEVDERNRPDTHDRCLDAACFEVKMRKAIETRITLKRQELPELIVLARGNEKGKIGGCPVKKHYDYGPVKKSDKGAVPAIDLDDKHKAGQVQWVRPYSYAETRSARGKKKRANAGPTPLKQRRAELEKRRQAWVVDDVQEMLEAVNGKGEFTAKLLRPEGAPMGNVSQMVQAIGLAATFGTDFRFDSYAWHSHGKDAKRKLWPELLEQLAGDPMDLVARLNRSVAGVLASRLTHHSNAGIDKHYAEAEYCCKLFDWDFAKLRAEAEAEIPVPKSWANLNENGTPKAVGGKQKKSDAAKKGAKGQTPPADKQKGRTSPVYYEPSERVRLPIPTARKVTIELKLAERSDGDWISAIEVVRLDGGESWAEDLTDRSVPVPSRESAILQAIYRIANNGGGAIVPDDVLKDVVAYCKKHSGSWSCLGCGCTNNEPCPGGCSWVDEDMCSQCANQKLVAAVCDLPLVPAKKSRKKAI